MNANTNTKIPSSATQADSDNVNLVQVQVGNQALYYEASNEHVIWRANSLFEKVTKIKNKTRFSSGLFPLFGLF